MMAVRGGRKEGSCVFSDLLRETPRAQLGYRWEEIGNKTGQKKVGHRLNRGN